MSTINGKIYRITNLIDGKFYIGQTTQKLSKRFWRHKYDSKKLTTHLHLAIKKYGPENFVIECLVDCIRNQDELNDLEKDWISVTNACDKNCGYNHHEGGNKPPIGIKSTSFAKGHLGYGVGIPRTEDVKKKVSDAQKGEKGFWFNKSRSEETKQKISKKMKEIRKQQRMTQEPN